MCNCLVFMHRKGPSDEYQALEKVHVRFRFARIRKLNHRICTCMLLIHLCVQYDFLSSQRITSVRFLSGYS